MMAFWAIVLLLAVFAQLAVGAVIIIGAIRMLRLQSYGWAMTASILALLPVSPVSLVGLVMGFWSLAVLNRRNVRAAFAENALGPEYDHKMPSKSSPQRGGAWLVWTLVAIGLALTCLIPPAVILAWRFYSSSNTPAQPIGPMIPIESWPAPVVPLPDPIPVEPAFPRNSNEGGDLQTIPPAPGAAAWQEYETRTLASLTWPLRGRACCLRTV
jgi:hypothetical protein